MADVLNANSKEARLAYFLRQVAAREMVWGDFDCGLWLADWVMMWRGVDDPAGDLRGRYDDQASCYQMLGRTPFPVIVGRLARRAGLKATRTPQAGAVAILVGPQGACVGAIRTPTGWALLKQGGGFVRVLDQYRVLGAWEVAECP